MKKVLEDIKTFKNKTGEGINFVPDRFEKIYNN
jgi:hypothetical protein